jgi:hypothetical protein
MVVIEQAQIRYELDEQGVAYSEQLGGFELRQMGMYRRWLIRVKSDQLL